MVYLIDREKENISKKQAVKKPSLFAKVRNWQSRVASTFILYAGPTLLVHMHACVVGKCSDVLFLC